ncbi:unnamed protein product [Gongylonema pulchrum]|uniref:Protein kinase domain-containing protein n=1 Tax=Gongylonema pulchrum TaxID=637853 RepID=A0A183EZJ8_9BILA|nr:unnamed protein product [Gongylonema pulchrum]
MAPEVDALLRVYERSKDADIERVSWAPLPTLHSGPDKNNPNLRIYMIEVMSLSSLSGCYYSPNLEFMTCSTPKKKKKLSCWAESEVERQKSEAHK